MVTEQEFISILKENSSVNEAALSRLTPVQKKRGVESSFLINFAIDDTQVIDLYFCINSNFPFDLPIVFIANNKDYPFHSNIEPDGYICYLEKEGIVYDYTSISKLINGILERVRATLCLSVDEQNYNFKKEYSVYWDRNKFKKYTVESFVSVIKTVKEVKLTKLHDKECYKVVKLLLFDDSCKIRDKYLNSILYNEQRIFKRKNGKEELKFKEQICNALYLYLDTFFELPPSYDEFFSYNDILKMIHEHIDDTHRKTLSKYLINNYEHFIIIATPSNHGDLILIGLKLHRNKKLFKSYVFKNNQSAFFTPFTVLRKDSEFIIPRGGGQQNFSDKKIMILGVGSLGSHILEELIKTGIINFIIIDPDAITEENIYRHTLGIDSVGIRKKSKVSQLKRVLELEYPFIRITTFADKIEKLINEDRIDLNEVDLIISALGNPTIELFINKFLQINSINTPCIFAWNESYGIGGHALVTNNNNQNGCLACLFDKDLFNRASFASKDNTKPFYTNISGCGSAYTPYSSFDTLHTVIITIQLAIDILLEQEKDNPLISWKGKCESFLANGYQVSERYSSFEDISKLNNYRYCYKNKFCPICSEVK